jgi:hypothetical protein
MVPMPNKDTMLHRAIVLLLIPTLLLQGMCFAHSHAGPDGQESSEHARTQHIHIPLVGGHTHHHHDGEPHHHHHDEDQDNDDDNDIQPGADNKAPFQEPPTDDHDDDAVYLSLTARANVSNHRLFASFGACFGLVNMAGAFSISTAPVSLPALTHPPPLLPFHDLPIYLLTLSLLI